MDLTPARAEIDNAAADLTADGTVDAIPRRIPNPPRNGLAMPLERRRLRLHVMQMLLDGLVLLVSFWLIRELYPRAGRDAMLAVYLLLPMFHTIAFYNSTYSRDGLTDWKMAAGRALSALLVSAILLNFVAFFAKFNAEFSRVVFVGGMILSGMVMVAVRYLAARAIRHAWGPSATNRLLIEAGGPKVAIPHLYRVDARDHGLRPDIADPAALDRLSRYLRNMDQVIVSCQPEQRIAWSEVLKGSGIHGEVISEYAQQIGALGIRHYLDTGMASLIVSTGQLGIRARIMKRCFDLALTLPALAVLSLPMLLVALAIKLEDGGPVFFLQRRMGRGNTFFDIIKFRSMSVAKSDPDGGVSASQDDARVTRVGNFIRRTSIDELPQLINVVRGDMSLVGPRPHALGSLAGGKTFWQVDRKYWQRHSLRPGITGLAQVRGYRGATDTERDLVDRLHSDMEYMSRWSLWRDVHILASTLRVLVHHRAF
ncbi:sugar transferase [Alteraurantiacibacter aquimixticola]|uniref:Sugar transferase n=1 Tax=Alteraurantiacibacter aquimixticola TaxID=2489173 RepID=A0A4T3F302_9SPHN|nr:sugar transferase [Alteraurantiacibacter aquimixticola]TIX48990.1 sugar transferase [Alteraurantiacibacter aquimixticola]